MLGLAVGFLYSFTIPDQWRSEATLQISGNVTDRSIGLLMSRILTRPTLTMMIRNFDLYTRELQRMPIEDVIEEMRRQIHIHPRMVQTSDGSRIRGLLVGFVYRDAKTARQVTAELVARFIDANMREQSTAKETDPRTGIDLQVLDPPSLLPSKPVPKVRAAISGMGLGAGLLVGIVLAIAIALIRRRPAADASGSA
jgi:hypothetical protein